MCTVPTVALFHEYRNDHDFSGLGFARVSVESAGTHSIYRFFRDLSSKKRHSSICNNEKIFFFFIACIDVHRKPHSHTDS